jgi:hypothetical protein
VRCRPTIRSRIVPAMPTTALANPDKPKRLEVRGKLRQSLDAMVWEGMTYLEAAKSYGFSSSSMRKALSRPHVLAYLRAEREVLRASASPRNIHRLIAIRDAADNMPAVNAIKALEQIGDDPASSSAAQHRAPGVVIVIQNGAPQHTNVGVSVDLPAIDASNADE